MRAIAARIVKRVLQRAETVVKGAERILVGAIGVRNGRQLDNGVRLDIREAARQDLVVARVHHMQRGVDLAQRRQALVDQLHVQLFRRIAGAVRKRTQVVDLQAVDDVYVSAFGLQFDGQIVADETGSADQRHAAPLQ